MEGKLMYVLLAVIASATAASISGGALLDPSQFVMNGQVTFPRIPGINAGFGPFNPFNPGSNSSSPITFVPPLGPIGSFLRLIPGANMFLPRPRQFPSFPFLDDLINQLQRSNNGTGNGNFTLPPFPLLPDPTRGPYIPGLTEALIKARRHCQAALNITTDLSNGMRDLVQSALNGDNPAESVRIILDTIGRVYVTVAANCPLILVGNQVFAEGIRLAGEVVRSIANVAAVSAAASFGGTLGTGGTTETVTETTTASA